MFIIAFRFENVNIVEFHERKIADKHIIIVELRKGIPGISEKELQL